MSMNERPAVRAGYYHGVCARVLALCLSGTALPWAPAAAQDAAQEGEIEFTFSADARDLTKIPAGAAREASLFEANLVITETVAGPMERMGARCLGLSRFDTGTQEWNSQGNCTWQDAEGDRIFETLEDSGSGGAAAGKATIIGGTGKFAGITGGYDYTLEFAASPGEGHTQWVGHKRGRWQMAAD